MPRSSSRDSYSIRRDLEGVLLAKDGQVLQSQLFPFLGQAGRDAQHFAVLERGRPLRAGRLPVVDPDAGKPVEDGVQRPRRTGREIGPAQVSLLAEEQKGRFDERLPTGAPVRVSLVLLSQPCPDEGVDGI